MDYIDFTHIVLHDATWQRNKLCNNMTVIPIYGNISCGHLRSIDENIDGYIEIPKHMIGDGDYFLLHASGDSMINAGIHDGDLIIIKRQPTAENGNIVAVMIDDEVTLKRFFRLDNVRQYKLHPENSNYDDIIIDNCDVLGIAVKILKNL